MRAARTPSQFPAHPCFAQEDNRQSVHDPGAGLGMKDLSLED